MEVAILAPETESPETWPQDVKLMMSVLEQTDSLFDDRRSLKRYPYRVKAGLEVVDGGPAHIERAIPVYTRDANVRGLGFVTNRLLPTLTRARLHLQSPIDRPRWIDCSILRCRPFIDGWFEGAVLFDYEQKMFTTEVP